MPRVQSVSAALLIAFLTASIASSHAAASAAPPAADVVGAVDATTRADATDRWIVVFKDGADAMGANARAKGRGIAASNTFSHALKGYAAKLTASQVAAERADPAVAYLVKDEVISMQAQTVPLGVRRTDTTRSTISGINGSDERVDADVAIFDTGIDRNHDDLNVVGGYNCASSTRTAWGDGNGHGTHVAGTVGALDNGIGVVGVAPGVRLWAVRILDSSGTGLVSWYVCGIDWLTAQREPVPGSETGETRPVIEAVNMSVAKSGSDDLNCGLTNKDLIHRAICRLVASGVTVVAAAGNNHFDARKLIPASYNEVITVSALADTDGRPGGLGGNFCYSWGSYDKDDTFADFSNYGPDVDLIAPGKCILSTLPGDRYGYLSGTSMAAPHVTGAVALYRASRPNATPAQVKVALQQAATFDWKTSTDPDGHPDRLLNTAHIVALGDYAIDVTQPTAWVNGGGATVTVPVRVYRAEDLTDDIDLTIAADAPFDASLSTATLAGPGASSATLSIVVPPDTASGSYKVRVRAGAAGRSRYVDAVINVDSDKPTMSAPRLDVAPLSIYNQPTFTARGTWAAASDTGSRITAYQAQWSADGGTTWSSSTTLGSTARSTNHSFTIGKSYALRVRARDSAGNYGTWTTTTPWTASVIQDTSSSIVRSSSWWRTTNRYMSKGSVLTASKAGRWLSRTFSGRSVAWVALLGPGRGSAKVYVNGVLMKTVNLHRTGTHYRRVVFSKAWPASGTRTIKIVVVGTSGHPRVDFDALLIIR
jgi:subtilisin